mmetsp:Transcript_53392/g.155658  ORF Transcript_53392/g.155658 Transcript_53392/m.155658 type:complete len:308 (-) Transcript_53392:278-1201(-)
MGLRLKDTASGACGAVCCTYAGLPFDVVKVRLQSQSQALLRAAVETSVVPTYGGPADCIARMVREEGITTFFRGAIPALWSAVSENAVGITVQHAVHRQLARAYGNPDIRFSMPTECLIGGFTGFFTSLAMCPFEVAKVKLQAASSDRRVGGTKHQGRAGIYTCMRSVVKADGAAGLYRGLTGLWARDIPFNALFYGSYESICTMMMWLGNHNSKDQLNGVQVMCAGGCAGAVGWSLVLPFDVVKTRQQTGQAVGSLFHIMRTIWKREGMSGLFAGWGPAVLRAIPANGGLFLGVELSSRWLHAMLG